MNELVRIDNQQVVTDSRSVAEHFGKRHNDVTEVIRKLLATGKSVTKMFHPSEFEYRGQTFPMYFMNRDGFSLLVMGFTGKAALEWKLKYIDAFNAMEKAIKTPQLTPNPHYRTRMIGTAVRDIGKTAEALEKVFGCRHGMALVTASSMVGEAYGIDTKAIAPLIPAEDSPCTMTVANIAEALGFFYKKSGNPDSQKVNRLLQSCGLQDKPRDVSGANLKKTSWKLTEEGRAYGESHAFHRNGHSGYEIIWNADVVELLRKALN